MTDTPNTLDTLETANPTDAAVSTDLPIAAAPPAAPPITIIDGVPVHEQIIGESANDSQRLPILMLHGWGAHSGLLLPLGERLARAGWRCYMPDLPGFGQTPPPPAVWSVHDYAAWVIRYMNAHQLTFVNLFGHSFGGRLGLVLGAEHSNRIAKMVLANSAGVRPKPSPVGQARQTSYKWLQGSLRAMGMSHMADDLRAWYINRYGSSDYKNAGALRETFVRVINEDLLPYAARVRPSTLLLWGAADQDTPLWQGQVLERTIPDAGLVVFDGAGHYSYLDALDQATRVITHFWSEQGT
jgi:pimeloyl-ACP methyl ester carboxylesterase